MSCTMGEHAVIYRIAAKLSKEVRPLSTAAALFAPHPVKARTAQAVAAKAEIDQAMVDQAIVAQAIVA